MDYNLPSREDVKRYILNSLSNEELIAIEHGKKKINYDKLEAFYGILNFINAEFADDKNISVGSGLFEPFPNSGFISISGSDISITIHEEIKSYLKMISNIEITSLCDNHVAITLTFNGIKTLDL